MWRTLRDGFTPVFLPAASKALARTLSVLLILLFVGSTLVEGLPDFGTLTSAQKREFAASGLMLAGLILAFFLPRVGGVLAIVGYVAFAIAAGEWHIDNPFVLFPLTGLLYLMASFTAPKATAQ